MSNGPVRDETALTPFFARDVPSSCSPALTLGLRLCLLLFAAVERPEEIFPLAAVRLRDVGRSLVEHLE